MPCLSSPASPMGRGRGSVSPGSVASSHADPATNAMFTFLCFPVFPNNSLCHTVLPHIYILDTHALALSLLWCSSASSAQMSLCVLVPSSQQQVEQSQPRLSADFSSRDSLSSWSPENLKAFHSWCLHFSPPTLYYMKFVCSSPPRSPLRSQPCSQPPCLKD